VALLGILGDVGRLAAAVGIDTKACSSCSNTSRLADVVTF
jgi:hypothetical protein